MTYILQQVVTLIIAISASCGGRFLLQETSTQNTTDSDQMRILVDMRLDGFISLVPGEIQQTRRTVNGCECIGWAYNNSTINGCGNPNGYSRGNWCIVLRDSCQQEPYLGVVTMGGQDVLFNYDLCNCASQELCQLSYNGCPCYEDWMYRGKNLSGCANPDQGVGGSWCPVDTSKCVHVGQVRRLENFEGSILGFWDYCKPGCCDSTATSTGAGSSDGSK